MESRLGAAVRKGRLSEVKRIIKENPDISREKLSELLVVACMNDRVSIASYILTIEGVDVNYVNNHIGKCAIEVAVKNDNRKLLQLLLRQTNIDASPVKDALTDVKIAVIKNDVDGLVKIIQENEIEDREFLSELLVIGSWYGYYEIVDFLLKFDGIDVNYKEKTGGDCAIHYAAMLKHRDVLERLLKEPKLDLGAADSEGRNVLTKAAYSGDPQNLTMVLDKIREVENNDDGRIQEWLHWTDDSGYSAINWAVSGKSENLEAVKILCEAGADINNVDNEGNCALIIASVRGYISTIKYLLEQEHVDYNIQNTDGNTALMWASTQEIEDLFLSGYGVLGVNTDLDVSGFRRVELIQAAAHGNLDKAKALLNSGADVNLVNCYGQTALFEAVQNGHEDVVAELLNHPRVDAGIPNTNNMTSLISAISRRLTGTVGALLSSPAVDVNRPDSFRITPLMYAVLSGEVKLVKILLELGPSRVDVNAKHTDGDTALDLAYDKRYPEIVDCLMMDERVLNGMEFTGEKRKTSCKIVAEAGQRTPEIWNKLLDRSPDRVMALLVMMAAEIKTGKIEKQSEFWKFVFQHELGQKYLKGDIFDSEKNTIFHHCTKKEYSENGVKLMKLLPIGYYGNLDTKVNCDGDTVFHYGVKNSNLDVIHETLDRFNKATSGSSYIPPWLNKMILAQNGAGNTFLAIALKSSFADEEIQRIVENLKYKQKKSLCAITDRGENTLLHLAAKFGRDKIVRFLAFEVIDEKKWNLDGHTALHVAVKENRLETLKVLFETFSHRNINVNEATRESETAFHIAAKNGNRDLIKQLVKLGANLAAQDEDGNTPLHDLVQFLHMESQEDDNEKTRVFKNVWGTLVEVCVEWWSRILKKPVPDPDSRIHIEMRHNAMYCLRSCVVNNEGLDVLEYAATFGLHECVQIMLTEKNIFVVQRNQLEHQSTTNQTKQKPSHEIEVTNLTFEYQVDLHGMLGDPHLFQQARMKAVTKNRQNSYQQAEQTIELEPLLTQSEHEDQLESTTSKYYLQHRPFLETLSMVKPPVKVSEELGTFPMEHLAMNQWYIYQIFYILFIVLHTGVMLGYTLGSQDTKITFNETHKQSGLVEDSNRAYKQNQTERAWDFAFMIYAIVLLMPALCFMIQKKVQHWKQAKKFTFTEQESFDQYVHAKGALLNCVTYLMAFLTEYLAHIIFLAFTFSSVTLVCVKSQDFMRTEEIVWIKGIVILTGWLLILLAARAYSPIYNLITSLKYIFLKDMVPFLLFYLILNIAFGCAIQLQFQLLAETTTSHENSDLIESLSSVSNVIWELFIMTGGMDTEIKNIQSIGQIFESNKLSSTFVEILVFVYGLTSILLLLNMLIGAMSSTYLEVLQKQGKGWRQYQVKRAIALRRFTCHVMDGVVRRISGARQDPETRRWYLPVSQAQLKLVRTNYWRN